MCNLFVQRTSCREFFVPFLYLNNSESNVPKHLQCRAFTLIPLKKKHLRVLRGLVIIHMCTQRRDLAVSKPHVFMFISLDLLYMTLDIPANAYILLAITQYFLVLAQFPFLGVGSQHPFWSPALTYFIAYITPFPLCLLNMQCAVILSIPQDDRDAVYHIETIFSLETVAQLHEAAGMCGQVDS